MTRILLVGDDLPIEGWPADAGDVRVFGAASSRQACRHLRHCRADVVLVNLKLPEPELIDSIKQLEQPAGPIPIILINDRCSPEFVFQVIQSGAQDILPASSMTSELLGRAILASIERKRLEQRRIHHARQDELTGLGNMLLLQERFGRALARSDRQATLVALVAIEIDQRDGITDMLGRHALDRLMPVTARRLCNVVRETDTLARTREAGFTWLVEGLAAINDITALVDRLPHALTTPFDVDNRALRLTVSVGVAVCPFHGRDFAPLLKLAEAAMLDVANLNGDGLLMPPLPAIAEKDRLSTLV